MKKIYSFMVAAVAMIAAVSCNKENLNDNHLGGEVVTFRASLDGAGTKAQLVGGKSQWQAKDAITVLNGNKDYKFSTNADGASVNFTYNNENNDFTGDKFVAVYPAQAGYPYSADLGSMTVNAHIPTWQEAVVDSYHKDAALSVAYTETDELKFMNAVALLKFTVAEANVKNVTFVSNDGSAVSGNVKISLNDDGSEIISIEGLPTTDFGFEPESDKVYMKPNSNWTQDNARFAAYFFIDDNKNTWVSMTDSDKDGIYEVKIPAGYSNFIFCRMNPSTTANNWNNKWNQTGNLTVTTNAIYEVSGWDTGAWKKSTLALRNYVELYAPNGGTLSVDKTYYMAVAPKTYEQGFYVELNKTKVVTKETEYEIKPSTILDLGELKSPKSRGLKYSPTSVEYVLGSTFNAPTLSGTTDGGITYESSNTSVASVDAAGNVTPLAVGTTTITASAPLKNGYAAEKASYTLKVINKKERNLNFSSPSATATFGESNELPTLSGAKDGVVYVSSEPTIAEVDAKSGVVKLVGAGTTIITASAEETSTYLRGEARYTLTVEKQKRNLKFTGDASSINGKGFTAPALDGVTTGVTYRISSTTGNASAKVNASGSVTDFAGNGTIVITASAPETAYCLADETTYTISVNMLYLKPNSNWTVDGARFAAYFFGNGETWVSMTDTDKDGVYEVNVPTNMVYSKVIFCRMTPNATANNWNNKWNQTGDLIIPSNGNNLFTVPNGAWNGSTTEWSKKTFE